MEQSEYIAMLQEALAVCKKSVKLAEELADGYADLYKQEKANNLVLKAMLFCLIAQRGNEQ